MYRNSGPVSIPYRLATNGANHFTHRVAVHLFQFLIGWLQTIFQERRRQHYLAVSIPYRLATNVEFEALDRHHLPVSIPYRLATNYFGNFSDSSRSPVSIPYRLATNAINLIVSEMKHRMFQFLIGWLQTPASPSLHL